MRIYNNVGEIIGKVDLIIDRGDKTVNLCEMKFVTGSYSISSDYTSYMLSRAEAFKVLTGTDKSIHLTMITSNGVDRNEGWQTIQSEVELADLFSQED